MREQNEDRLLTRQEVADRFGVSKRFLEIAVMRNEGPNRIYIGRSVRYRVRDIQAWIEKCAVGAASDQGIVR